MKIILRDKPSISGPVPGPRDPDRPPLPVYEAKLSRIQQIELPEEKLPRVRRVVDAEVGQICKTVLPLFEVKYPRLELDAFVSFIRQALHRNDFRVVRTDAAWGYGQITRTFYEPAGWVDAKVAMLDKSFSDPVAIYLDLESWAKQIGMAELRFDSLVDNSLTPVAKRLGASLSHNTWVKELL